MSQQQLGVFGAATVKHGVMCLPDFGGWGPTYAVVLHKVGSVAKANMGGTLGFLLPVPVQSSDDEEEEGAEEQAV
jgi:hypothetical protein